MITFSMHIHADDIGILREAVEKWEGELAINPRDFGKHGYVDVTVTCEHPNAVFHIGFSYGVRSMR